MHTRVSPESTASLLSPASSIFPEPLRQICGSHKLQEVCLSFSSFSQYVIKWFQVSEKRGKAGSRQREMAELTSTSFRCSKRFPEFRDAILQARDDDDDDYGDQEG